MLILYSSVLLSYVKLTLFFENRCYPDTGLNLKDEGLISSSMDLNSEFLMSLFLVDVGLAEAYLVLRLFICNYKLLKLPLDEIPILILSISLIVSKSGYEPLDILLAGSLFNFLNFYEIILGCKSLFCYGLIGIFLPDG